MWWLDWNYFTINLSKRLCSMIRRTTISSCPPWIFLKCPSVVTFHPDFQWNFLATVTSVSYTHLLLTGGALRLCALVGIFVLTQAFGKRLSQFTADLCQTLDHMIAGNEAPQRPEDSETQLARIGHRLARLYPVSYTHLDVYKRQDTEDVDYY